MNMLAQTGASIALTIFFIIIFVAVVVPTYGVRGTTTTTVVSSSPTVLQVASSGASTKMQLRVWSTLRDIVVGTIGMITVPSTGDNIKFKNVLYAGGSMYLTGPQVPSGIPVGATVNVSLKPQ